METTNFISASLERDFLDKITIDVVKKQTHKLAEKCGYEYKDGKYIVPERSVVEKEYIAKLNQLPLKAIEQTENLLKEMYKSLTGHELNLTNPKINHNGFVNFSMIMAFPKHPETDQFGGFFIPNIVNKYSKHDILEFPTTMYNSLKNNENKIIAANENFSVYIPANDSQIESLFPTVKEKLAQELSFKIAPFETLLDE